MLFLGVPKTAGQVDIDPLVDPSDVEDKDIVPCPPRNPGSDRQPSRILITAEGIRGDRLTVTLWAQAELPRGTEHHEDDFKAGAAARRFYRIIEDLRVTVGELSDVGSLGGSEAGSPAVVTGVAGTFPTGFTGGETLNIEIDSGGVQNVIFTAAAQTAQQVCDEINAEFASNSLPEPCTVEGGELRFSGLVPSVVGEVDITASTGAATLGLTVATVNGTDGATIAAPVPPGGKIYIQSTTGPEADIEVKLACVD